MPYLAAVVSSRSNTGAPSRLSRTRSLAMTAVQSMGFCGGDTAAAGGLRRIVIRPLSPFLRYLSSINSRTAARTGLVLTWYRLESASNVSPSELICPERMFAMRSCLMNVAMDIRPKCSGHCRQCQVHCRQCQEDAAAPTFGEKGRDWNFGEKGRDWNYGSRGWSDSAETAFVLHDVRTHRRGGCSDS